MAEISSQVYKGYFRNKKYLLFIKKTCSPCFSLVRKMVDINSPVCVVIFLGVCIITLDIFLLVAQRTLEFWI